MTLQERVAQLEQGLQKCMERERQAQAELARASETKRKAKIELAQAREARLHQEGAILAVAALARDEDRAAARGVPEDGRG